MFQQLESYIESIETALISNKEDTSFLLGIVATQNEEIDKLTNLNETLKKETEKYQEALEAWEKQQKGAYILGNVLVVLPPIGLAVAGVSCIYNDKQELGWHLIEASCYSLIALEVTYQGGHWIFKWW